MQFLFKIKDDETLKMELMDDIEEIKSVLLNNILHNRKGVKHISISKKNVIEVPYYQYLRRGELGIYGDDFYIPESRTNIHFSMYGNTINIRFLDIKNRRVYIPKDNEHTSNIFIKIDNKSEPIPFSLFLDLADMTYKTTSFNDKHYIVMERENTEIVIACNRETNILNTIEIRKRVEE